VSGLSTDPSAYIYVTNGEICDFEISEGKKYFKIIKKNRIGTSASVHSFVNKENGDIYKVSSANAPAKHARGNIFNENGASALSCYQVKYLK